MSVRPKNLIGAISKKIPEHKGNSRIWIESRKLDETVLTEWMTYHYKIDKKNKRVIIESKVEKDDRKITRRKSGMPIIDINNKEISELFEGLTNISILIEKARIIICPLKEEIEQNRARKKLGKKNPTFIDIFAGGSTLTYALKLGKLKPVGMVEIEQKYTENYILNNPNTFTYNTDVAQMDIDLLPDADIVAAGIPCQDYSKAGVSKKKSCGIAVGAAGLTGALGIFLLNVVEKSRPAIVIIENSSEFKSSPMRDIITNILQMRGYKITEKIVKATEYGGLSKRTRYCMVATMADEPFVFQDVAIENKRMIGDILEVPLDQRVWLTEHNSATIKYSLEKERRHIAKGEGFRFGRTRITDKVVGTITRGIYKLRLTDIILVHPDDENKFSQFTPKELARIQGLCGKNGENDIILPEKKTPAGEIIGNGVSGEVFEHIGREIQEHIRRSGK